MSTAKTRRPATAADPQRGASAKKSGKAREPIPVLIRLPELRTEPETEPDNEVLAAEEASREAIPLPATPTASVPPPALHAELSRPDTAAIVGEEPRPAAVASLGWHRPSWFEFRLPHGMVRGGIALGLVTVLIIAFFAISGRSRKAGTAVTEDKMASPAAMFPAGVPAVAMPAAPPAAAAKPLAPADTTNDKEAAGKAEAAEAAIVGPANAAGSERSQAPQQPPEAAKSAGPPAGQTQTPRPQQGAIPQAPVETAAAAGGQQLGSRAQAPAPADADSRSLPASGTATGDAGVSGGGYSYPLTNPATFQYPPDYHERLQGQPRGGASLNGGPAPSGAGQGDQQPSTARLQPRMEPPPIR